MDRGWSQRDLQERSGVSRSRISQIERGVSHSLGLDLLLGLQRAFGLDSIEALLGIPPSALMAQLDVGASRGTG
jgi:transcriptional regulator with XRE-family HTH domain